MFPQQILISIIWVLKGISVIRKSVTTNTKQNGRLTKPYHHFCNGYSSFTLSQIKYQSYPLPQVRGTSGHWVRLEAASRVRWVVHSCLPGGRQFQVTELVPLQHHLLRKSPQYTLPQQVHQKRLSALDPQLLKQQRNFLKLPLSN